ncbi:LysR family transcriptional regulator [Amylibacter sp. SFDW26]|uniref:LysR family transcriptional regulator n=1 Tax=Amylibacter sp. SFDW26 TaxID=2652722 RepID=UPI001261F689|nr:LysR family transcriptional regulator [Amylibacter sp. SFDW26]KAB7614522.1 LysR family transcriptional regulator [Amylibacter sp. SFDW26]
MNLRSFECVVALAEEAHFGQAANRLNITQPALSQRIATLEDQIGYPLFTRTRGPIYPTKAGIAFIRRARIAIANAKAAQTDAKLAATGLIGELKIGFTQIVLYRSFPQILRQFHTAYSGITTVLHEQYSLTQEQALLDGRIDVGLVHPPLTFKELDYHDMDRIPLVMVVPDNWPQAQQGIIKLSDCKDLPFILPPREIGPVFYDGLIAAFTNAGISPNIVQKAAPMSMLIGLASAGIGAGFVAECLSVVKMPGVTFLPVEDDLPKLPIAVAWNKDTENPAITHFVETALSTDLRPIGLEP